MSAAEKVPRIVLVTAITLGGLMAPSNDEWIVSRQP
jgi:hypothetical protein